MDNLSGFLGKFQQLLSEKNKREQVVCDVIQEVCGVTIPPQRLRLRKHTLVVHTDASTKSVLFMKKEVLIKKINKTLGAQIITEIR